MIEMVLKVKEGLKGGEIENVKRIKLKDKEKEEGNKMIDVK